MRPHRFGLAPSAAVSAKLPSISHRRKARRGFLPRTLSTPGQLAAIGERRPEVEIIYGAAGNGKTATALLRLGNLSEVFKVRNIRTGSTQAVRVLILTCNTTSRWYVGALAREQATAGA